MQTSVASKPNCKNSPRQQWREYVSREVKKLPAPVRGLLFQLYDRMDSRGECFASNENLAKELDVSTRTVQNYIRIARERGLLETIETERGRVFRATIPAESSVSNVVPMFPEWTQSLSGGVKPVSPKAGKAHGDGVSMGHTPSPLSLNGWMVARSAARGRADALDETEEAGIESRLTGDPPLTHYVHEDPRGLREHRSSIDPESCVDCGSTFVPAHHSIKICDGCSVAKLILSELVNDDRRQTAP